jgi:heme A synthase
MVEATLLVIVVLACVVMAVADEDAVAVVHRQGQPITITMELVHRFVARAITIHFSVAMFLLVLSSREHHQARSYGN